MRRVLSISEVVQKFAPQDSECEVCATAEADYDEAQSQLVVTLDSFIRSTDLRVKEEHSTADWLPRKQTFKTIVARTEAVAAAKNVFHRWVGKVRQSILSFIPS